MGLLRRIWTRVVGCRRHDYVQVKGLFIELPGFRKKPVMQCRTCGMVATGRP